MNQSPSSITVNEGDSAQITCCWNKIRVKVAWYINETRLSGVNVQRQENQTQNCSTLHLTNILKNDTGHYVCKVTQDIPVLVQVKGNGTDLSVSVRQRENTTTGKILLSQYYFLYTFQLKDHHYQTHTVFDVIQSISSVEVSSSTQTTQTTHHTSTPPQTELTLYLSLAAAISLVTLCLALSVCKMRNSCKKTGRLHFILIPRLITL